VKNSEGIEICDWCGKLRDNTHDYLKCYEVIITIADHNILKERINRIRNNGFPN